MATPMKDGEVREVWGSGSKPYVLKNINGVNSCSCPAWRNQSKPIDERTCKHLKAENGAAFEEARIAGKLAAMPVGVPAPQCDCHQGGTCDISHDPTACSCAQCVAGQESPEDVVRQVMEANTPIRVPKATENTVPGQSGAIERDKSKRLNRFGGFVPFTDQEKAVISAEEEARLGRKLRQDEKTDLFGPDLLLANQFEDCEDMDPAGWLESEKLDGLRGLFTGELFVSRQGNVFAAPAFFWPESRKCRSMENFGLAAARLSSKQPCLSCAAATVARPGSESSSWCSMLQRIPAHSRSALLTCNRCSSQPTSSCTHIKSAMGGMV